MVDIPVSKVVWGHVMGHVTSFFSLHISKHISCVEHELTSNLAEGRQASQKIITTLGIIRKFPQKNRGVKKQLLQGGPLQVINRVITPINGLING